VSAGEWLRDLLRLKRLPRTGWLHVGVAAPESVADHSFSMAVLGWRIARETPGVDAARVVLMCLLHDFHEARLGDIPTPAKHYLGPERILEAERAIQADQWEEDAETCALLEEFLTGETEDARLARALDHLEFLVQAMEYRRCGYERADRMLNEARRGAAFAHAATRPWAERVLSDGLS
jgi:putative hydrolase of HD superfamily